MKCHKIFVVCAFIALLAVPFQNVWGQPRSGMPLTLTVEIAASLHYDFGGQPLEIPFSLEGPGIGTIGPNVYIAIYKTGPDGEPELVVNWEEGIHRGDGIISWDGKDANGELVPSGEYSYFVYALNGNEPPTWCGVQS